MENIILQMADKFYLELKNLEYEEQKAVLSTLQILTETNYSDLSISSRV